MVYPRMIRIKQHFNTPGISNVKSAVRDELTATFYNLEIPRPSCGDRFAKHTRSL